MGKKVRIALWNIESCLGIGRGYWQYPLNFLKLVTTGNPDVIKGVSKVLSENKADVISLIENDSGSLRNGFVDQTDKIKELLGIKNAVFFETFKCKPFFDHGNSIISDYEIRGFAKYKLPGSGEPRFLGKVVIKIGKRKINFFVIHLSLNLNERKDQIKSISKIIKNKNSILLGDFNIADDKELKVFEEMGFGKISEKTYPSWNPNREVDCLFFSKDVKVKNFYVIKTKLSDHLPIFVEIMI